MTRPPRPMRKAGKDEGDHPHHRRNNPSWDAQALNIFNRGGPSAPLLAAPLPGGPIAPRRSRLLTSYRPMANKLRSVLMYQRPSTRAGDARWPRRFVRAQQLEGGAGAITNVSP
jgi:hypothetical protein